MPKNDMNMIYIFSFGIHNKIKEFFSSYNHSLPSATPFPYHSTSSNEKKKEKEKENM